MQILYILDFWKFTKKQFIDLYNDSDYSWWAYNKHFDFKWVYKYVNWYHEC